MRLPVLVLACTAAIAVAGCSSGGSSPRYSPEPTTTALKAIGWSVTRSGGGTVSKVTQTGFLKLTAPDGTAVDLQFIATDATAKSEFAAASTSLTDFQGTLEHNAIIFLAPLGKGAVPAKDIAAVRGALH